MCPGASVVCEDLNGNAALIGGNSCVMDGTSNEVSVNCPVCNLLNVLTMAFGFLGVGTTAFLSD